MTRTLEYTNRRQVVRRSTLACGLKSYRSIQNRGMIRRVMQRKPVILPVVYVKQRKRDHEDQEQGVWQPERSYSKPSKPFNPWNDKSSVN